MDRVPPRPPEVWVNRKKIEKKPKKPNFISGYSLEIAVHPMASRGDLFSERFSEEVIVSVLK